MGKFKDLFFPFLAGLALVVMAIFMVVDDAKTEIIRPSPACSPMFEVIGESGVFGCIKGTGLSGKFTFQPCTGPSFEVDVVAVKTTRFTCADAPTEEMK